jgi:nicotinate-nucleotide adenylyltransferase
MLAILGGTFDPIHLGHIKMAEIALEELNASKIVILPSGDPPHKLATTSACHRYNMAKLACRNNKKLIVSRLEIDRRGLSYTLDTLLEIKKQKPKEQVALIVGSDSLHSFPSWHEPEKIASLCTLAVVLRNEKASDLEGTISNLSKRFGLKVHLFKKRGLDISSTQIRKLLHEGKDVSSLLNEDVLYYIKTEGLYR